MKQVKRVLVCVMTGAVIAFIVYTFSQTLLYYPFLVLQSVVDDSHFTRQFAMQEASGIRDDRIVIVDIDDMSLRRLGNRMTLWPRQYFADVIGTLSRDGARLIFLDILFTEGGRPAGNEAFADSVRRAGNVISGYYVNLEWRSLYRRPGNSVRNERFMRLPNGDVPEQVQFLESDRVTFSYRELVRASANIGYANYQPDFDGVLRHIPVFLEYQQWVIPSASLQVWLQLEGRHYSEADILPDAVVIGDMRIPTDRHAFMRINYTGLEDVYRHVSFADVLRGMVEPGTFTGKIVLIGSSSARLGDIKRIPGKRQIPGVEVHAAALSTMLSQNYLRSLPGNVIFLVNLVLGMCTAILFRYVNPLRAGLLSAILVPLLLYVTAMFCFSLFDLLLNTTIPTVTILVTYVFVAFYLYCRSNLSDEQCTV